MKVILQNPSHEQQEVIDVLQGYTFDQYLKDIKQSQFMKVGFNSWLAYGNISKQEALSTIKKLE
jgi:hypothetical protein